MSESTPRQEQLSGLIDGLTAADPQAVDELLPFVYEKLKQIARRQLGRGGGGQTLCTTELVHETYVKLAGHGALEWNDRAHFYCLAARAMRQVLVDHARRRAAAKRGGGRAQVTLTTRRGAVNVRWLELLALDEALDRLEGLSPRLRTVVECRFFGGMTEEEIATALSVSTRTVERDWVKARLFLHRELHPTWTDRIVPADGQGGAAGERAGSRSEGG